MPFTFGITTTIPVEIIYAAGHRPLDLNNVFIVDSHREKLIAQAEKDGFPTGVCAWIKGLYAAAISGKVDQVVCVVNGDCSNSVALGQVLAHRGVKVIEFAFPHKRDPKLIENAINDFATQLGAIPEQVTHWKSRLDQIREKLITLDELTWKHGKVSGKENGLWLVNSSDFESDPDDFESRLDNFLIEAESRKPVKKELRIGVIGVPTILDDLYESLEERGVQVVFNEVQRQFAMPSLAPDLVSQYMQYTYPFDLPFRVEDIVREVKRRKIDALVHYIQNFCHRQIEDIVIREKVGVPVLSVEADNPGPVDGRTLTRIDAFLEMLRGN